MRFFGTVCALLVLSIFSLAIDREAFTIAKYDLQVQLEPEQHRLGARGKVTLRNDSLQPQRIAVLQVTSSLDWRSIKVDGKPVQFVSQPLASDIDHTGALSEAIVTLPAEIKSKDALELEIAYEGTVVLDTTRLTQVGVPEAVAKRTSWDQIGPDFTAVRGVGHVAWYPIATESADFSQGNSMFQVVERWKGREQNAIVKLAIGTDAGTRAPNLLVLCNGKGGSGDTRAGGPHFNWAQCEFDPLGPTVPMFVSGIFTTRTESSPLGVYALAANETGASTYVASIGPAAQFVNDWFGAPKTHVRIVDLADANVAPFESGNMLLASMASEDAKLAGINVVHMLTHSAIESPRPWIQEGLAHFAEAAYREQQGGREAALMLLGIHRSVFLESEKEVSTHLPGKTDSSLVTTFDESYYRSKAAYVWWMLRDMVGEGALKQVARQYRAEEDRDPKYAQRLIETASKRDLSWFFEDWVYHDRGLPDFRVQSVHPWKNDKGAQMVTLTVENLGKAGAEVPFTVRFADGEITRRLEVRANSSATTRIEVPGVPTEIVINDGSVPESDLGNNVIKLETEGDGLQK